jgi:hypothetical protein
MSGLTGILVEIVTAQAGVQELLRLPLQHEPFSRRTIRLQVADHLADWEALRREGERLIWLHAPLAANDEPGDRAA